MSEHVPRRKIIEGEMAPKPWKGIKRKKNLPLEAPPAKESGTADAGREIPPLPGQENVDAPLVAEGHAPGQNAEGAAPETPPREGEPVHEDTRAEQKRQLEEAVRALMEREMGSAGREARARKSRHEKYAVPTLSPESPRKVKWDNIFLTAGVMRERHAAYENAINEYQLLQQEFFRVKGEKMRRRGSVANLGAFFKRDWSDVSPRVRQARIRYERASQELSAATERFTAERLEAKSFADYKELYLRRLNREAKASGVKPTSLNEDSPAFRKGLNRFIEDYNARVGERFRGLVANRTIIRDAGIAERKAIVSAFDEREQGRIERTIRAVNAWYQKQPIWRKVLLGTSVTAAVGGAALLGGAVAGTAIGSAAVGTLALRSFAKATALTAGLTSGFQAMISRRAGRAGDAVGNRFGERIARWRGVLGREQAVAELQTLGGALRGRADSALEIRRRRQEYLDALSTEDKIELYEKGISNTVRAGIGAGVGTLVGVGTYEGLKNGLEAVGADIRSLSQVSEAVDKAAHESGLTADNQKLSTGDVPTADDSTGLSSRFDPDTSPPEIPAEGAFAAQAAEAPPPDFDATRSDASPRENAPSSASETEKMPAPDVKDPESPRFEASAVITEDAPGVEGPHNAIHGLRELQNQLRADGYDPTNAPALVKHILETNPETLAKETGFYQPNESLDSGIVHAGDKFEFTKEGVFRFIGADGKEIIFGRELELENLPETVVPDADGVRRGFEDTGAKFEGKFMDTIHEAPEPSEVPLPVEKPSGEDIAGELTRSSNLSVFGEAAASAPASEAPQAARNAMGNPVEEPRAPLGPPETGIPSVDAVTRSGLWNAFQNTPARAFVSSWPLEAESLRTQVFEVVRASGVGPEVNENLAAYIERATPAAEANQSALGGLTIVQNENGISVPPNQPSVYETSNETIRAWLESQRIKDAALIVDGGDSNARLVIANEYLRLNPGAVVFYEVPNGSNPNLLQATAGGVSEPLSILKPSIETYVARRF